MDDCVTNIEEVESIQTSLSNVIDFCDEAMAVIDNRRRNGEVIVNAATIQVALKTPMTVRRPSVKFQLKSALGLDTLLRSSRAERKQPFINGIEYLSDSRIGVIDNENNECWIIDKNSKVTTAPYAFATTPRDITCISNDTFCTFAVTVSNGNINTICILKCNPGNRIICLQKTIVLYDCCDAVCMIRHLYLVSTLNAEQAVFAVDENGTKTTLRGLQMTKKIQNFGDCKCVYDRNIDTMFITDKTDNSVCVHNKLEMTKNILKDANIKSPIGICLGPAGSGSVFVCCSETNNIAYVGSDGQLSDLIDIDLETPEVISFDNVRQKLSVVSNKQRSIVTYDVLFIERHSRKRSSRRSDRVKTV
ncbi:hypothetical protein DPMN_081147 [Dreissena polymorpha]|uniref:Uncharacterized protein n=1 Tax=Dreissena polymorpha TaxID=45954 RepID=A0A9D3Y8A0_DREPO|nr:hypothetical protein DPMN_081147 [Dreissena polymorpha]